MTITAIRPTASGPAPIPTVERRPAASAARSWTDVARRSATQVDALPASRTEPDELRPVLPAPDGAAGAVAKAEVIERYLPLAAHLARRFSGRGEPVADLIQVAVIGLMSAVDRFDAGRGVPFTCYATPTIVGHLKRHFRDATWYVRVPRNLQDLRAHLATATEELSHALRRTPTTGELAAWLDVPPEDVQAARLCSNAYRPISFDQPPPGDGWALIDTLGAMDPGIDAVVLRLTLRTALEQLSARDRSILGWRFFADMTQTEIGTELGISQMHVSRLLVSAVAKLRALMLVDDAVA